jgi:hypothetical protein
VSQVNGNGKGSREGTLFIVIGAQSVECGFKTGLGNRGNWLKTSFNKVPLRLSPDINAPYEAVENALEEMGALLKQRRSDQNLGQLIVGGLHFIVADQWLAVTTVPWSRSVSDAAGADAYARSQLASAGFAVDFADTVRLEEATYGTPRLAVSYPATLMQIISTWSKKLGTTNISILPMSVVMWNGVTRQQSGKMPALGLMHDGLTLIMRSDAQAGRRMQEVFARNTNVDPDQALQSLREQWQRTRIRDQRLKPTQRLPILNIGQEEISLSQPDADVEQIRLPSYAKHPVIPPILQIAALSQHQRLSLDALPQAQPISLFKTLLSLAALALAGVLVFQAWQTRSQLQGIESSLTNKTAPVQQTTKVSLSREELARVPVINKAIRELNMPISALLRALNPPRDIRVAILSVETTGTDQVAEKKQATVKIQAEARSDADMTRFVAYVAERQPFIGAYLTHHEVVESLPEKPYRFTLEATWLD